MPALQSPSAKNPLQTAPKKKNPKQERSAVRQEGDLLPGQWWAGKSIKNNAGMTVDGRHWESALSWGEKVDTRCQ